MRILRAVTILAGVLAVVAPTAAQWGEPEGLFSLTPVQTQSCLALSLAVPEGQALAGVRWYNNDGSVPFVRVWGCAGWPEQPPSSPGAVDLATNVMGSSLAWSTITLAQPVASSTGYIQVVFQLPPFAESEAEGLGGGPGIGYRAGEGHGWLTADGEFWIGLPEDCALLCEPILIERVASTLVLSPAQARERRVDENAAAQIADIARPVTELAPPYPNPFNPQVSIKFTLGTTQRVVVQVYDVKGRLVREVWDRQTSAGPHVVAWDGTDVAGQRQASGVYLVRLVSSELSTVRRVMLIK